ncbi:MAG: ABC transporter permease [Rhodospirillaceae bacterium]|nr:ABC transporter permease [Rhodospirillaceae bacterium]
MSEERAPVLSTEAKERIVAILSPIAILAFWQTLSWVGILDQRFVPSPVSIALSGYGLIVTGELFVHIEASLARLFAGFALGIVPGILLGLVMGLSRWVRAALDPIVSALYPVPKIAILPLVMLFFGIGDMSKIVLVALAVVFLVLINTMAGVMTLDKVYFDVARNYGASWRKLFIRVVIPGALPLIFVGLRLGIGVAFIVVVAAEFVAARSGIGFLIWTSWEVMRVENMFVGIIVITILGILSTMLLREIERWALPWRRDRM